MHASAISGIVQLGMILATGETPVGVAVNASHSYISTGENNSSEQNIPVSPFLVQVKFSTLSKRFECTGSQQQFTVPLEVTQVHLLWHQYVGYDSVVTCTDHHAVSSNHRPACNKLVFWYAFDWSQTVRDGTLAAHHLWHAGRLLDTAYWSVHATRK